VWEVSGSTLPASRCGRRPREHRPVRGALREPRVRFGVTAGRVWRSGEPSWVADIARGGPAPRRAAASSDSTPQSPSPSGTARYAWRDRVLHRQPAKTGSELMRMLSRAGRQSERQLERGVRGSVRQSEALRGAVLEAALDCVITMNHDGRIWSSTARPKRPSATGRADVVGKLLAEHIIPPSLRKAHWKGSRLSRVRARGRLLGKRLELTGMRAEEPSSRRDHCHRIGAQEPRCSPVTSGPTEKKQAAQTRSGWLRSSSTRTTRCSRSGGRRGVRVESGAERLYGYTAAEAIRSPHQLHGPPHYKDESAELVRARTAARPCRTTRPAAAPGRHPVDSP
jgi:PAS domain-containing protein